MRREDSELAEICWRRRGRGRTQPRPVVISMPVELTEIWRAERTRALAPGERAILDTVEQLRAMGLVVAVGVRSKPATGELCIVWVAAEDSATRQQRSS